MKGNLVVSSVPTETRDFGWSLPLPRAEVIGNCEQPNVGAGNQTQVISQSSADS